MGTYNDTGLRGGDALMAEDGERLMTTAEFAAHFRVSVNTVYKWIAAGEVEVVRVGSRIIRFSPDAMPKSHRQEPAPTKPDDNLDRLATLLAKVSDEHPDEPEAKALELLNNETDKADESNVVTLVTAEQNE